MVKDDGKMLRHGGNYLFIYIRQWGYIKKMLMDDGDAR
jgi:inorganic pyrophosphatase